MRTGLLWPTPSGRPPVAVVVGIVSVFGVLILTAEAAGVDPRRLVYSAPELIEVVVDLVAWPEPDYLTRIAQGLGETLGIAFLATLGAFVLCLPLGVLAAGNTTPHRVVAAVVRAGFATVRALPELVWALVFVSAVGLGATAGVLALGVVSIGLLGKFFADSIEVVPKQAVEGVAACGANGLQLRLFAYLPQAVPDLIGYLLYQFDHNVRAAALVGIVGAGGLGYDLKVAVQTFQFGRITGILAALFVTVAAVDALSDRLRRRIT